MNFSNISHSLGVSATFFPQPKKKSWLSSTFCFIRLIFRRIKIVNGNQASRTLSKKNVKKILTKKLCKEAKGLTASELDHLVDDYLKNSLKRLDVKAAVSDLKVACKEMHVKRLFEFVKENDEVSTHKHYDAIQKKVVAKLKTREFEGAFIHCLKAAVKSKSNKDNVSYMLRFLDILGANNKNDKVKASLERILHSILKLSIKFNESLGPSTKRSKGSAPRAPNDVLIHLLARLNNSKEHGAEMCRDEIKRLFLMHANARDVEDFLFDVIAKYPESNKLVQICQQLILQLSAKNSLPSLQDSIYSRAFETAFVVDLVENPPAEVCECMTSAGKELARHLLRIQDPSVQKEFATQIHYLLTKNDPRFWFPKVPEIGKMQKSNCLYSDLIDYLNKPKTTGIECISIPYLIVKVSLALKLTKQKPSWLSKSDVLYNTIFYRYNKGIRTGNTQAKKANVKCKNKMTEAGIMLPHQPSVFSKKWMASSSRPVLWRKPNLQSRKEHGYNAMTVGMQNGIPWVSGISGSVSISLHFWKRYNSNQKLEKNAFLLASIMFLTYDGGHSIHEALWAGLCVDKHLNIGFDYHNNEDLEAYIANYEKFANMYSDNMKKAIEHSFEKAFDKVVDYFKEHSAFANTL